MIIDLIEKLNTIGIYRLVMTPIIFIIIFLLFFVWVDIIKTLEEPVSNKLFKTLKYLLASICGVCTTIIIYTGFRFIS